MFKWRENGAGGENQGKINFVLTRKYSKVLEKTRIYSNILEMCTNMWFLVSDCVFYWFFAKVERVWSESEVKWSEFVSSWFTRINYNLLEKTLKDSKVAQIVLGSENNYQGVSICE